MGSVGIGGANPIRIQSMTTTDTMDTKATVEQSIRMIEAGCALVRITAPSINEAQNLKNIKRELKARGYDVPLIADIHFTPNAAELAARIVEKVRVNPGNYADKKKFQTIDYNDAQYNEELERIREKFIPLVKICKEHGTAMRIGTNHGSLSDRIMSRYGDTPLGMVESAFEFLRIAEDEGYREIVLSMKASNTEVMVHAYRLLVSRMMETNRNYPLHLGVTEAGDGEDGRIKSAIGIGTLLEDGLGDTIRVSLTEDPEFELPVAKILANRYNRCQKSDVRSQTVQLPTIDVHPLNPFEHLKRETIVVGNISSSSVPVVVADLSDVGSVTTQTLSSIGYMYDEALDKWHIGDAAPDYLYMGNNTVEFDLPGTVGVIVEHDAWVNSKKERHFPILSTKALLESKVVAEKIFVRVALHDLNDALKEKLYSSPNVVLVLETENENGMTEQRRLGFELVLQKISNPVIIHRTYNAISNDALTLHSSTDAGALLLDGIGNGIWLSSDNALVEDLNRLSFGILQGTRQRISKTEYISCPSCGRTLFDLQETTAKIRAVTHHLKGVKIAIMGCIVNGPGEMADADYGYVGSGIGKITLYKGKDVVKRGVPSHQAVDELIQLIKDNGDWVETPQVQRASAL